VKRESRDVVADSLEQGQNEPKSYGGVDCVRFQLTTSISLLACLARTDCGGTLSAEFRATDTQLFSYTRDRSGLSRTK
jgi:hypothetical protein